MKKIFLILIIGISLVTSCKKDDNEIEYQEGYPNKLAGNWVVFEFQGGNEDGVMMNHDLVTALDPNNKGALILDKLYDSDIRVRAAYDDDTNKFSVEMGPQLETINDDSDVKFISLNGKVSNEYYLVHQVYLLAYYSFDNIAFEESDIKDAIIIYAGYYDKYKQIYDTTLIMGYRKTGFEEVEY
jgi:hypothetical protein